MKWGVSVDALVAVLLCCCFQSGFGQNTTDIYHGCYFDNPQRALTDLITCDDALNECNCGETQPYCESMEMMTVDLCRGLCRRRNLRYYALEAGQQCFCGGALSDPFQHGNPEGKGNCSYPCTGNKSQTCGGEFRMQVYEFKDPLPGLDCFQPGYVKNSFISHNVNLTAGETISYLCLPKHRIMGEPQITCQADGSWIPSMLPICNYTDVIEEPTTKFVTTMQNSTTIQATTAAKPLNTITDFLPYIIGGSALLLAILVVCVVGIFVCGKRRSGNAGQNISLKPEPRPVTFINNHGFQEDEETKVEMPDILSATGNNPSSPLPTNPYQSQMSTFAEEPIYHNSEADATVYAVSDTAPLSPDDPPSPIYLNAEAALPDNEQATYANTGNRRAKKGGTGTKDLIGWSRPSSLYQRTEFDTDDDEESNEDNMTVEPNALTAAIYAQIDKNQKSGSRETLNSEVSGNSFFADPAKSSATRL